MSADEPDLLIYMIIDGAEEFFGLKKLDPSHHFSVRDSSPLEDCISVTEFPEAGTKVLREWFFLRRTIYAIGPELRMSSR